MQRTLVPFKPDCVLRRLVGVLFQRFEQKGLRLVGMKFLKATPELAAKHYAVHIVNPTRLAASRVRMMPLSLDW